MRAKLGLGTAAVALALAGAVLAQENAAAPANNAAAPENISAPPAQPAPAPQPENAAAPAEPAPAAGTQTGTSAAAPPASGEPAPPLPMKHVAWSFDGPFGTYDRAQLQRGFQVYREVCSACHSLKLLAFRNLGDPGGPGFSEAEVKAIAAGFQVPAEPDDQGRTHDDAGQRITRPGTPADYFPGPYANERAARAANLGALPPDQSVIVKARHGGPDYVYSLLTGYGQTVPHELRMAANMNYNPYFSGHQIAMAPPLSEGLVTYGDGTQATVDQMAKDVAAFLAWAGDPKMEERKRLGMGVLIFMFVLAGLLYLTYRKVWHAQH
ncbi:MAG: cytochrome c1 [Alphaproteobacteria bacterium]